VYSLAYSARLSILTKGLQPKEKAITLCLGSVDPSSLVKLVLYDNSRVNTGLCAGYLMTAIE
jgi:hypothetical protein